MATAKLSLSFRIFHNGQLVREDKLSQGVIKIGKVPSAHLRLDDDKVSRMHAIIEVLGNEVSVIDLGSTGGTFVNGQKVNKAKLVSGDAIEVGDSRLELTIVQPAAEPSIVVAAQVAPPPIPVRVAPAPVAPAMAPVPAPRTMPAMPAMPVTQPVAFQQAMAESAEIGGARAVEVAAMLGDSVVSVKHCMDPRSGKVTPLTWGFAAGGLAALIASASAFYVSVDNAATNKTALAHWTEDLKRPSHAFRPVQQSVAVDTIAFGGLALGLFGLTTALARSRRERKSPFYRIGTAANVEQPVANAPAQCFPLVAPAGDDFVFNFAPGIDGEMTVDGQSAKFSELIAQNRARPSAAIPGAFEVPIPMAAKIHARTGNTTFLVSSVNKPRETAAPLFAMETRTLAYFGGSLAAHLAVVFLLRHVALDGSAVNADMNNMEDTQLVSRIAAQDEVPPEDEPEQNGDADPGKEGAGAKMALEEGAAGKPNSVRTEGHMTVKNNGEEKHLSRDQALEAARTAGILGSTEALRGGIASLTASDPFSSGLDGADMYGQLFGADGEGRGNFGGGRNGWGVGGGCTVEPCGIIGTGRYGTFGTGRNAGDGWRGGGSWGNGRPHNAGVPKPLDIGQPTTGGNLDKAIIKRYIKRNINKISYCYESELLARPGIQGTVSVSFLISGTGSVQSSSGAGFDNKVASCVAGVIKNIEFPRPTDGGNVQVNYPFTFHAAGAGQ